MPDYALAINPCIGHLGSHDSSAILFEDGELVFGVEEERFVREKHAPNTFPAESVRACLNHADISMSAISEVLVPWKPRLFPRMLSYNLGQATTQPDSVSEKIQQVEWSTKHAAVPLVNATGQVRERLADIGDSVPPIQTYEHHRCHAASAFYPSGFDDALVVTMDARGEYDCTVVWRGSPSGLERVRTYEYPNSLGFFYGGVTKFLGYYPNNGEGKIMGLAPYGNRNETIERKLRDEIDVGLNYDVKALSRGNFEYATSQLEELFDRERKDHTDRFSQWEKDLAHVTQKLVEETVTDIVDHYCSQLKLDQVCLAGGVALNCKVNKQVMEIDGIEETFVQPVSNDAGSAVGAGFLHAGQENTLPMSTVYWGPSYDSDTIEETLTQNKISYSKPDDLAGTVAKMLADGKLVGWFQGGLEGGPRALGNRSILADPRSEASLDRVNKFVKHREEWRPFAPSMLEDAIEEYLVNAEQAPYMIKTFDVVDEKAEEIPAVLHPADDTTRPQTVREDQNPRYYELIEQFEQLTGVPVVLNTSFNDHGEPIVNTPVEAIKDFYGMGLDVLVLDDIIATKPNPT
jgi:carbamoyltransferase